MSLLRAVVRLILKKTSLLLSVTLMLRCSARGASDGSPAAPPEGGEGGLESDSLVVGFGAWMGEVS